MNCSDRGDAPAPGGRPGNEQRGAEDGWDTVPRGTARIDRSRYTKVGPEASPPAPRAVTWSG